MKSQFVSHSKMVAGIAAISLAIVAQNIFARNYDSSVYSQYERSLNVQDAQGTIQGLRDQLGAELQRRWGDSAVAIPFEVSIGDNDIFSVYMREQEGRKTIVFSEHFNIILTELSFATTILAQKDFSQKRYSQFVEYTEKLLKASLETKGDELSSLSFKVRCRFRDVSSVSSRNS